MLVEFVEADLDAIKSEIVAAYETKVGRVLQPAQVETLLLHDLAYREYLVRQQLNSAANQNLVAAATGSALEYLAQLVGVTRLAAAAAVCVNRFTLVSGHGAIVIPAGLRVASVDGAVTFQTRVATSVDALTDVVDIEMIATTEGVAGNGYEAGKVATILDPQAYLSTSENIDTTAGGTETESDEAMRERIRLAPASFSTAGSRGAYIFHAKSAHPSIVDVSVDSPTPGLVRVFPLVEGEIATPTPILTTVEASVSGEKVRPLTDTVQVLSPTKITYNIDVELTLFTEAAQQVAEAAVLANLQAFAEFGGAKLGRDRMLNAIRGLCMSVEGVYDVNVVQPAADVIVAANEFASCLGIAVTTTGTNEG